MKSRIGALLLTALCAPEAGAQDMWLESSSFLTYPGQEVTIRHGNGIIFEPSRNALGPERIAAWLGLGPDGRSFRPAAPYVDGNWLNLDFQPGDYGNYWIGLASIPARTAFSGEDFNRHLEQAGNLGMLVERQRRGILDRNEVEESSHYAKTYIQVGKTRSRTYRKPLGLKIEIVPLKNPYALHPGDALPVRVLFEGRGLEGLNLQAGSDDRYRESSSVATGRGGKANIHLSTSGRWYVRGNHVLQVEGPTHSYESYRAALTFEVAGM